MFLKKELAETEEFINYSDRLDTKVSEKGVDWHIDHLLKVVIAVSKTLQRSDPKEYKWNFNFIRSVILTFQTIPKGKGRAPKAVVAVGEIKKEEIYQQLNEAKDQMAKLGDLHKKSNFKHPYFGILNLRQSKNFLKIHTRHHLKIIKNIIA